MHSSQWRLQDAKNQFSQLVEAALRGEPQHVTRRGREAVVVLSESDYRILRDSVRAGAPSFIKHLLAIPKSNAVDDESRGLALRDVEL